MEEPSPSAPAAGPSRDELEPVLRQVFDEARAYPSDIADFVAVVREAVRGVRS